MLPVAEPWLLPCLLRGTVFFRKAMLGILGIVLSSGRLMRSPREPWLLKAMLLD